MCNQVFHCLTTFLKGYFLKISNLLYKSFSFIKFKTDTKYFWKEEKCDKDARNLKVNAYVMILFE